MQLGEPIVNAMVTLLAANLNTTIDALNATITDGYVVPHAAQVLNYIPVPSTLEGGMPAIGVQELPAEFVDDLQFSVAAEHEYAVVAIVQHADHRTLVVQLRRMLEAIAYTIQQDRLAQPGIMRAAGAESVNLGRTEPGPVLGDIDFNHPEVPPSSWMSWCALTMTSRRQQAG